MCDTCGCNITPGNRHLARRPQRSGATAVTVLQNLLAGNNTQADANRARFNAAGVLVINLMSSPGSGKTSLLEATIDAVREKWRVAVIEGDLETENDAQRIRAHGVPAVQITTGTACHLDAHMIDAVLDRLSLEELDVLFVENVGNLVCPAGFDLGQHHNAVLLSVTEGDDKPAKYPVMFRAADIVLLTKTDLLAVLEDFDPGRAESCVRDLASSAPVLRVSARKDISSWLQWLEQKRDDQTLANRAASTDPATAPTEMRYRAAPSHEAETEQG